jgi:tRNA U34 5-methylaminomethyl-2-thiouridine-forming methyltransferase MnmC
MTLKIIPTADNSNTLYNESLDETYHSRNGAVEESRYVFIDKGVNFAKQHFGDTINVLEIGFGTGLNAILSLEFATEHHLQIDYHTLETYPIGMELIASLHYEDFIPEKLHAAFHAMHSATWNSPQIIQPGFTLTKHQISVHEFIAQVPFHVIYFDAFAPDKQPDMWQPEVLKKLYDCLVPGGIWVTYSSKGQVKRNLRATGFNVERLPGPPRKRHMLRATK